MPLDVCEITFFFHHCLSSFFCWVGSVELLYLLKPVYSKQLHAAAGNESSESEQNSKDAASKTKKNKLKEAKDFTLKGISDLGYKC